MPAIVFLNISFKCCPQLRQGRVDCCTVLFKYSVLTAFKLPQINLHESCWLMQNHQREIGNWLSYVALRWQKSEMDFSQTITVYVGQAFLLWFELSVGNRYSESTKVYYEIALTEVYSFNIGWRTIILYPTTPKLILFMKSLDLTYTRCDKNNYFYGLL